MFTLKHRPTKLSKPLTQAEIDRSIILQSSQIKKDFNARLMGKDDEMKILIDTLIKSKNYRFKTKKAITSIGQSPINTTNKFEETGSGEYQSKTIDVGVGATSKDIDLIFNRSRIKNSSGDQIKEMTPVRNNKKIKFVARQLKKEIIPQKKSQVAEQQMRALTPGRINSKNTPKQGNIPKRQTNSNKQLILTSNTARLKMPSAKPITVDAINRPKNAINKKLR